MTRKVSLLLALSTLVGTTHAFVPSSLARPSMTKLQFGIPTFGPKNDDESEKDPSIDDKKIGLGGLVQLVTAGLGAPFLGDYQGVDKASLNEDSSMLEKEYSSHNPYHHHFCSFHRKRGNSCFLWKPTTL